MIFAIYYFFFVQVFSPDRSHINLAQVGYAVAVLEVVVPVVVAHQVSLRHLSLSALRHLSLSANPTSICFLAQYGLAHPIGTPAFLLFLPPVEVA